MQNSSLLVPRIIRIHTVRIWMEQCNIEVGAQLNEGNYNQRENVQ